MNEPMSERRVWNTAVQLIRAFGGEAPMIALEMASRYEPTARSGDADTMVYATWLGVARASAELVKPEPDIDELMQ
jgi:hypothetical protein